MRFVDTFTDRATGRSFTVEGRFTEREQQAERLAGSVLRLTLKQSGASATVRDAAGRVVARDRGTITATVVFDTGGDDVPGGQVLSFTDDRISGPHPFLEDQCAVIDRALA